MQVVCRSMESTQLLVDHDMLTLTCVYTYSISLHTLYPSSNYYSVKSMVSSTHMLYINAMGFQR